MVRNAVVACFAGVVLGVGCAKAPPTVSPFAPDGKLDEHGVIAVVHVNTPFEVKDAALDVMLLDAEQFGGRLAAIASGAGAERVLQELKTLKILGTDPSDPLAFRVSFPSTLIPGADRGIAGPLLAGTAQSVRRFDLGDAIALVPTVDLQEVAFALHAAIASDGAVGDGWAVAINGPEIARFVQRSVVPAVRSAVSMMQMMGRHNATGADGAMAALDLLAHAIADASRWTVRAHPAGGSFTFDGVLEPVDGSELAGVVAALAPISGDWPQASRLRMAFDPEPYATALEREASGVGTGETAERAQAVVSAAAKLVRTLGIDRVALTDPAEARFAFHCVRQTDPDTAKIALSEFLAAIDGPKDVPPLLAREGWLFMGELVPLAPAGASADVVLDAFEIYEVRRTPHGLAFNGVLPTR